MADIAQSKLTSPRCRTRSTPLSPSCRRSLIRSRRWRRALSPRSSSTRCTTTCSRSRRAWSRRRSPRRPRCRTPTPSRSTRPRREPGGGTPRRCRPAHQRPDRRVRRAGVGQAVAGDHRGAPGRPDDKGATDRPRSANRGLRPQMTRSRSTSSCGTPAGEGGARDRRPGRWSGDAAAAGRMTNYVFPSERVSEAVGYVCPRVRDPRLSEGDGQ